MNMAHVAPFCTITDADVGLPGTALKGIPRRRLATRVVLLSQDRTKVALMYSRRKGFFVLPGGKVEISDKNLNNAALREIREETGCTARLVKHLGVLEEHRGYSNHRERSHCILAQMLEQYKAQLTPHEVYMQFECVWLSFYEAMLELTHNLVHEVSLHDLAFRFISKRELAILARAQAYFMQKQHEYVPA